MNGWNAERLAVVDALTRDVLATLRTATDLDLAAYVLAEAERISQFDREDDDFAQQLVDDVQQAIHDEFIDTCWPQCPDHDNHPLWFENGAWRCLQNNVAFAALGGLAKTGRTTER